MIATNPAVLETLDLQKIQEILRSTGPCITIVLPPYHPGEPAQSAAALLKANLQDVSQQLVKRGLPEAASGVVLEPLERLADDPASLSGSSRGRVIFRSPDVFCQFELKQPAKTSVTVGGCFAVRKLLPGLLVPGLFYILAVSKDSVRLFRCTYQQAEAVSLPAGVPATLEEALALEPPDHDLENRAAVGTSTGSMHAVRFGTGSGRETKHAHLADYYKLVDRGIHRLLHDQGIPLLLAGVDEDTAIYHAISSYGSLVKENLQGGVDLLLWEGEIVPRSCSILRAEELQRAAEALTKAKAHAAPGHFSADPHRIARAAFDGRVHHLFVDEGSEISEVFERSSYRTWGNEDLLNLAVVETLLHRGKAFELPRSMMPVGAAAVAIMRY